MNVLIFGATGMVGLGVLIECLDAPDVETIRTVGRNSTSLQHPKLRQTICQDLSNYSTVEPELVGFDACFFCLGVSSVGMEEAEYERITYGIAKAAAETLARLNPAMTFIYVSGAGTDGTQGGRIMWARVKGKTENAIHSLFKAGYSFRPGVIEPVKGVVSKTPAYRVFYVIAKPLLPLLRWAFPNSILTTAQIGQAMLNVARKGYPSTILESKDIRAAAAA
jgi:uncharacterized protein YbjT (DUF2867 family)